MRLVTYLLAALVAAILFAPTAHAQASGIVDCAVGYTAGPEYVVLTMASPDSGQGVRDSGSFCTQMIQTGDWMGIDRFVDWEARGYRRLCYVQLTNGESVIVHVSPDPASGAIGSHVCDAGGAYVYYFGS